MSRASSKNRTRTSYKWKKGKISNVGVTSTYPAETMFGYIRKVHIGEVVEKFFVKAIKQVTVSTIKN